MIDTGTTTSRKNVGVMQPVQTYEAYGTGQRRVTEHSYVLPKGKHKNLLGSYSYTKQSPKAGQLKGQINRLKGRLQRLDRLNASGNYYKTKQWLENEIKQLQSRLSSEVAAQGVVRVNVYEQDDEE